MHVYGNEGDSMFLLPFSSSVNRTWQRPCKFVFMITFNRLLPPSNAAL